jgi:hypothetical protein
MRRLLSVAACVMATAASPWARATEPNEDFASRTILPPGVLSVSDELTAGSGNFPDTLLGIKDHFGSIYHVDDDGSPLGDDRASGVGGVLTNSGEISFCVTGFGDDFFTGSHNQQGAYRVFIDVYDFGDELVDSFFEDRVLEPGEVHGFSFNDFEWLGGNYDVYIDNTIGGAFDVDFFTFVGLSPGAAFTAEIFAPTNPTLDTVLGWFDSSGNFLVEDDDAGSAALSKLQGTVPNDGALTFAVTGFGDDDYLGEHTESGLYELRVTLAGAQPGDFDNDNDVDGNDLMAWRNNFGPSSDAADADDDGDSDGQDFLVWQQNVGGAGGTSAVAAVPEPSVTSLLALAALSYSIKGRGSRT